MAELQQGAGTACFVFWIHGEGQPLPEEKSLWSPAGRSGLQWGAGGPQRREEGDVSLCCSAARSQMGGTTGGTCQLPVFSTIPSPWGLWVSSVDDLPHIYVSWMMKVGSKALGCRKWCHIVAVLPFCVVIGFTKNPIHFQVVSVSSLVSKGGKSSLWEKKSQR